MRKGIGLQKKLAERNDADCHNGRRCAERRTIRDVVGCRRGRTTALKRPGAGRPCRRRAPWPSSGSFREAKARKAGAVRTARSDPAGSIAPHAPPCSATWHAAPVDSAPRRASAPYRLPAPCGQGAGNGGCRTRRPALSCKWLFCTRMIGFVHHTAGKFAYVDGAHARQVSLELEPRRGIVAQNAEFRPGDFAQALIPPSDALLYSLRRASVMRAAYSLHSLASIPPAALLWHLPCPLRYSPSCRHPPKYPPSRPRSM